MLIAYIDLFGCGHNYLTLPQKQGESWCYVQNHSYPNESVWAVPGTLAETEEPVIIDGRRVATIYR